jgi:C4-dicarboxylate transporter DctM subunit
LFPELGFGTVFRGMLPFVVMNLVCIALLIAFPSISTWLPYALRR